MSEPSTNVHVVCDPDGAPMRAFTDEDCAKSFRHTLKQRQPQAKYKISPVEVQGDLGTAVVPDRRFPSLSKIHVVLGKKREPHIAYVDYDLAKHVGASTKGFTRATLILDRSEFDV